MNIDNLLKDLKSWKTTIIGFLAGIIICATQIVAILDSDPATVFELSIFLAGLAAMGIGVFAKDGDKSTEDVE